MNTKFLKVSLLLITSSAMFISGCGPQDLNDAEYLAQAADANADEAQAPAADDAKANAPAEGCPTGGCPTGGCPTGGCETPSDPDTHKAVQLPDQVVTEDVKVDQTEENQMATDTINYSTTRHINQPSQTNHTVKKHRHLVETYQTKNVFHPSHRTVKSIVRTFSSEKKVLPDINEVAPMVEHGCSDAVEPVIAPVAVVRPVALVRPYAYGVRYPWLLRRF